ncbi:ABC transporter [Thiohalocapsa marina]|uniref:ABC transporter n=1 Tax=Thiohalocapsa marina TaxID=424902 RepID=A0A5M8FGE3_9GAMM|nr:metal ABC transporter permease [Thiohalocapsa marina]KAA6182980.1 ABC transporter [Thiohalocapsa marina]
MVADYHLLDPLFRLPLLGGLLLACTLPLIGSLLLLRDEWLAALGFAHLAAAGALLGLTAGLPAVLGGTLAALAAGAAKALLGLRGNVAFAFMILAGWSAMLLTAANSGLGDSIGHAMMQGQLYFAGRTELIAAAALAVGTALALPWLIPRLLRARLFPRFEAANRLPAWRWHLAFDLLGALALAIGTATLGLMGAFALAFVPAWIAFALAPGWRWALALALGLGATGYLTAFQLALMLDQPFGPTLVAVLLAFALLRAAAVLTGRPRQ